MSAIQTLDNGAGHTSLIAGAKLKVAPPRPNDWIYHRNHLYQHHSNKPSVCLRCRVKRRYALNCNGGRRGAVDASTGLWQYQAPCSRGTWQHERLPCAEARHVLTAPAPGPHAISLRYEPASRSGELVLLGGLRAHCSCGWWSDCYAQMPDTQRAVEVHLRRSRFDATVHHAP
jgi:hypothetical protein